MSLRQIPTKLTVICCILLAPCCFFSSSLSAQQVNPLQSDPRAARAGGSIFRAQCASCHGGDARGIDSIDAPDLSLIWLRNDSNDSSVFSTIKEGIPGSIMPAHGFPDAQIWMLVSYLRSIAISGTNEAITGDPQLGAQLFATNCLECHRVDGRGGSLGPDLSRITNRRTRDALLSSIREPSVNIGRRYRVVSLTVGGQQLRGTVKSEDAFSIQLMDSEQHLKGYQKSTISSLERESISMMPGFSSGQLSDEDVDDILSFLQQE